VHKYRESNTVFPPTKYLKWVVDTGILERVHIRFYYDSDSEAY
jgi:hypothetical protein